jgi:hypothetical protein
MPLGKGADAAHVAETFFDSAEGVYAVLFEGRRDSRYVSCAQAFAPYGNVRELDCRTFEPDEHETDELLLSFRDWRELSREAEGRAYGEFLYKYYRHIRKRFFHVRGELFGDKEIFSLPYLVALEPKRKLSCHMLVEIAEDFQKEFGLSACLSLGDMRAWLAGRFMSYFGIEIPLYLSTEGANWDLFLRVKFCVESLGLYLYFPVAVEPFYYEGYRAWDLESVLN